MMWEDVFSAIGGGLQGGVGGYKLGRDLEARDEELAIQKKRAEADADIKAQANEIRMLIAELNERGRGERFVKGEEGKTERLDKTLTNRSSIEDLRAQNSEKLARMRDDTTRRGQDVTSGDRRYGIDTGAAVTRRGQDVSRYGIDTGAETARRGQDLRHDIGLGEQELQQWNDIMDAQIAQGALWNAYKGARGSAFGGGDADAEQMPNYDTVFSPIQEPGAPPAVGRGRPSAAPVGGQPAPVRPTAPPRATPPQGGGGKMPAGFTVGQPVTLRNGQKGTVTGVTPDGKLRIQPQ